ncbi:MAG: trigger factor family protein [bacterium]|nr:trigger factor family protein [bacterium]
MDFKFKHTVINPVRHKLEIEVPWSELEKRIPKAIAWFKPRVEIGGFRKGMAPEKIIRARVGEKEILKRAADLTSDGWR